MPTNPISAHHDFMRMLKRHVAHFNFFSEFMDNGFCKFSPCENMSHLESSGRETAVLKCLQENKIPNTFSII